MLGGQGVLGCEALSGLAWQKGLARFGKYWLRTRMQLLLCRLSWFTLSMGNLHGSCIMSTVYTGWSCCC